MGAYTRQPDAPIAIGPRPYTSWRAQPLGAITEDLEQRLILDLMGDLAGRRVRGWRGSPTWRAARFRSAAELSALALQAGLSIAAVRGAVFYPPIALAARAIAPIDHWLGRRTTVGAAFIAFKAQR